MSDLVERVARAICADDFDGDTNVYDLKNNNFRANYLFRARAAIAVALEEAAQVAESYEPRCDTCPSGVAAAIRAMIPKEDT